PAPGYHSVRRVPWQRPALPPAQYRAVDVEVNDGVRPRARTNVRDKELVALFKTAPDRHLGGAICIAADVAKLKLCANWPWIDTYADAWPNTWSQNRRFEQVEESKAVRAAFDHNISSQIERGRKFPLEAHVQVEESRPFQHLLVRLE